MEAKVRALHVIGLLLIFVCAAGSVYGQEGSATALGKGGMGYFMGGVGMFHESDRNSVVYSVGGGGHSLKNRMIIGGEGHSSFGPENAGGYGFFDIGYALVLKNIVILYPLVGIGGGAMTRTVEPTVSSCALLNPTLCIDYLLFTKNRSGVILGLRVGYTFTLYSDTWNWSMPYIRLVIGGFGFEG
jgi:hypothetical protein